MTTNRARARTQHPVVDVDVARVCAAARDPGDAAWATMAVAAHPRRPNLFAIATDWQIALDAAQRATQLASAPPVDADVGAGHGELQHERLDVGRELRGLARLYTIAAAPQLPAWPVTPPMLGLPSGTKACVFDLDGVLTDSGVVHALAWGEVLDDLLLRLADETGRQFVPFDPDVDYRTFLDGRLRLDGVHAFLAGRGIHLATGRPDDAATAETAHGLAKRKAEAVQRILRRRGVAALPGARRYLELAGYAGLRRGVVSASAMTLPMLDAAGLTDLVDTRVDARVVQREHLRPRPAPDILLAACRRLAVGPADVTAFTNAPAGVEASRAAGIAVRVVGTGIAEGRLAALDAPRAVRGLDVLLDARVSARE